MVVLAVEDGHRDGGVRGGGRSQMVVLTMEDGHRDGGVRGGGRSSR